MMITIICFLIALNFVFLDVLYIKHNRLKEGHLEFCKFVSAHIDNWHVHSGGDE